jgi:hypothetical protein
MGSLVGGWTGLPASQANGKQPYSPGARRRAIDGAVSETFGLMRPP